MGLFQRAIREQLNLRMALVGPSGSGKTLTALKIAQGLAGDKKIAVIDTERGSARRYANLFEFYVVELAQYSPHSYIQAIQAAEAEGFGVLVIDSLSHAWMGKGGILDLVDRAAKSSRSNNSFVAWGEATPQHNALIEAILDTQVHVLVTMRSKTQYVLEEVERNGRKVTQPRKVGIAPIQRNSVEYEFDIVADMDTDNNLVISKSRCMSLTGAVMNRPGEELGVTLKAWVEEGVEPAPRTRQSPQTTTQQGFDKDELKALTLFLYPNPHHQDGSIEKLIREGQIKPSDPLASAAAIVLLHRAEVNFQFDKTKIVEALNAALPEDEQVTSYGDWRKRGHTMQAAWEAITAYAENATLSGATPKSNPFAETAKKQKRTKEQPEAPASDEVDLDEFFGKQPEDAEPAPEAIEDILF